MTDEKLAALPWHQRGLLGLLGWTHAWRAMKQTDRALEQTETVVKLAREAVAAAEMWRDRAIAAERKLTESS